MKAISIVLIMVIIVLVLTNAYHPKCSCDLDSKFYYKGKKVHMTSGNGTLTLYGDYSTGHDHNKTFKYDSVSINIVRNHK